MYIFGCRCSSLNYVEIILHLNWSILSHPRPQLTALWNQIFLLFSSTCSLVHFPVVVVIGLHEANPFCVGRSHKSWNALYCTAARAEHTKCQTINRWNSNGISLHFMRTPSIMHSTNWRPNRDTIRLESSSIRSLVRTITWLRLRICGCGTSQICHKTS